MTNIVAILLFFVYIWCFGFTALKLTKTFRNTIEGHLLALGIGLGIMPIIGVIFNLVHIPITWILTLSA
jgi:hypothetical protein